MTKTEAFAHFYVLDELAVEESGRSYFLTNETAIKFVRNFKNETLRIRVNNRDNTGFEVLSEGLCTITSATIIGGNGRLGLLLQGHAVYPETFDNKKYTVEATSTLGWSNAMSEEHILRFEFVEKDS